MPSHRLHTFTPPLHLSAVYRRLRTGMYNRESRDGATPVKCEPALYQHRTMPSVPDEKDYTHDYARVNYPDDRPEEAGAMEDFDAAQRRAWVLDKTYKLGTPTRINQSEVCEYVGVR